MNIPINFISEDNPKELKYSYTVEQLRQKKQYVYILTNTPKIFNNDFIKQTDGIISSCGELTSENIKQSAFYLYFSRGDFAIPEVKRIISENGVFISPNIYYKVPAWQNSDSCIDIYNEIAFILNAQPKGPIEEMASIMQAIDATKNIKGDYVELGVFSGTSALAALLYMRNKGIKRRCWLMDTYSGFTYKDAEISPDIKWFNTHQSWDGNFFNGANAIERIKKLTKNINQEVIPVEFNVCNDTMPDDLQQIVVANLDVDMYDATLRGLKILAPRMISGGIITTEDPVSTHGLYGAYVALNEFLESEEGKDFFALRGATTYYLVKR